MIIFQSLLPGPYVFASVELDGAQYTIEYRQSFRYDRITINIYDALGDLIAASIKLVAGANLLEPFSDERLPPGTLRVAQLPGNSVPTLETLGVEVWLIYFSADEDALVLDFNDAITRRPQIQAIT